MDMLNIAANTASEYCCAEMPRHPLAFAQVQELAARLRFAVSTDTIRSLLARISHHFGFEYFSLCRFAPDDRGDRLVIGNLPPALRNDLREATIEDSPLASAARARVAPFFWDIATRPDAPSLAGAQYLEQIWIVPFHIPGDSHGFCAFFRHTARDAALDDLFSLQFLAWQGFEAVRRIRSFIWPQRSSTAGPRLTPRQLQCAILAARGKSDWVAGQLLGLAPATVHKYLEQAKARYGVSSRTELVIRALHDGHIHFQDLIDQA